MAKGRNDNTLLLRGTAALYCGCEGFDCRSFARQFLDFYMDPFGPWFVIFREIQHLAKRWNTSWDSGRIRACIKAAQLGACLFAQQARAVCAAFEAPVVEYPKFSVCALLYIELNARTALFKGGFKRRQCVFRVMAWGAPVPDY